MKKYYGFEYHNGRDTTAGEPNPNTGRYSIAGELHIFNSIKERDSWVQQGTVTEAMQGLNREAVPIRKARKLLVGLTMEQYWDLVEID